MLGFNPKMIKGRGTGKSDSIKKKVPRGTYIMPADSTEQLGLDEDGMPQEGAMQEGMPPEMDMTQDQDTGFNPGQQQGIDINVSNGEAEYSPEMVQGIGEQVLNDMKDQTHTDTGMPAQGFNPQTKENEVYFRDGGTVDDEERKRRQREQEAQQKQQAPTIGSVLAGGEGTAKAGIFNISNRPDYSRKLNPEPEQAPAPTPAPQSQPQQQLTQGQMAQQAPALRRVITETIN